MATCEAMQILEGFADTNGIVLDHPFDDKQLAEAIIEHAEEGWAEVERLRTVARIYVEAYDKFTQWVIDGCEYHPLVIAELQEAFNIARNAAVAVGLLPEAEEK